MKKIIIYFPVIISLTVVVLLFMLITKPQLEQIKNGQKLLGEIKEKLSVLTKKSEFLSKLDEMTLKQRVDKINLTLPSEKSATNLIFTLDRLSQETSVSIVSLSFAPGKVSTATADLKKETASVIQSMTANLIIKGRLEDLITFLNKIKKVLLALKIIRINISQTNIKDPTQLVDTNLSLEVFYRPVSLTLGEISQPISLITEAEEKLISEVDNLLLPEEYSGPAAPLTRQKNLFE